MKSDGETEVEVEVEEEEDGADSVESKEIGELPMSVSLNFVVGIDNPKTMKIIG